MQHCTSSRSGSDKVRHQQQGQQQYNTAPSGAAAVQTPKAVLLPQPLLLLLLLLLLYLCVGVLQQDEGTGMCTAWSCGLPHMAVIADAPYGAGMHNSTATSAQLPLARADMCGLPYCVSCPVCLGARGERRTFERACTHLHCHARCACLLCLAVTVTQLPKGCTYPQG
jgi:hypothetical protein